MIDIEEFMPFVLPKSKGVSYTIALHEILQSIRELCGNAAVWKEDVIFDLQRNVVDYELDLPSCAEPVRAHELWIGNTSWRGRHPACTDTGYSGCGCAEQKIRFPEPRHMQLAHRPPIDVPEGGYVRIQVKPRQDARQCHPILLEQYNDAVSYGALYRLLTMYPEEPFFSPDAGRNFQRLFQLEKTRAKNRVSTGFRAGTLTMQGRYF
jgi:hypothetical protein